MPAPDPIRMKQLLDEAQGLVAELQQVLEEERAALRRRDPAAVATLAQRKQACSQALDAAGRQLVTGLGELGIDVAGGQGAADALAQRGLQPLAAAWQELRAALQRVRDLNQANGRAIAISQRAADRLLDLLRGNNPAARLYDPRGRSRNVGGAGYLAKA